MRAQEGLGGGFTRDFEPFSRQAAQLISEFKRRRIGISTRALIPPAQPRTHFRRQQVLDYLVNSGGMRPFNRLKHIVRGNQRPYLAQVLRGVARLAEALVVVLLQLSVSKVHAALEDFRNTSVSALHKADDIEKNPNRPRAPFLWIFLFSREQRGRVMLQFLEATRTRIGVKEVAKLNAAVRTS